jgi:hypothetical protein
MQKQETVIDSFNDWLQSTGYRLPACPISRGKNWSVAEHIVEFRQYQGGHFSSVGSVYPAVMIICQDCGYTIFVNAALIGLV